MTSTTEKALKAADAVVRREMGFKEALQHFGAEQSRLSETLKIMRLWPEVVPLVREGKVSIYGIHRIVELPAAERSLELTKLLEAKRVVVSIGGESITRVAVGQRPADVARPKRNSIEVVEKLLTSVACSCELIMEQMPIAEAPARWLGQIRAVVKQLKRFEKTITQEESDASSDESERTNA